MTLSGLPPRRRRHRRRKRPVLLALLVASVFVALGFFWVEVFSPLFSDPDEWVDKNQRYTRLISEVVTGRAHGVDPSTLLPDWPSGLSEAQFQLLACAQSQVALGVKGTRGYHSISYPWGDIPSRLGTSPDLVIRCLREIGLDLQQLIHIDRVRFPRSYPLHLWARKQPDRSIDHRRLPNMGVFFRRFAGPKDGRRDDVDSMSKTMKTDTPAHLAEFQPGDLVFWSGPRGGQFPSYVGVVSDRRDAKAVPRVITQTERGSWMSDAHALTRWQVMGHYRIDPDTLLERFLEKHAGAPLMPRETLP